jgi:hypothetical protein
MNSKQFTKETQKIQEFLWLKDWDFTITLSDDPWYVWCLRQVDYLRFQAYIDFSTKLLSEDDKFIISVIMHEMCHIFTISSLKMFEDDEYIKEYIGKICHSEMISRMNLINEQMTVRMERLLTKYYE